MTTESLFSQPQSLRTQFKAWVLAARPRTLLLSYSIVLVGATLSYCETKTMDWWTLFFYFLSLVFMQIGSNIVNDASDFKRGADNLKRIGFKRVSQSGILNAQTVLLGGIFCIVIGFILGIPLIIKAGWPLFIVLLFSALCAYCYTGGPFPLAYHGLGEVTVLIFWGWIGGLSLYYLLTERIDFKSLLLSTQMGMLLAAVMSTNNLRDIESDKNAHKKTLVVRFGMTFGRLLTTFLLIFPLILGLFWVNLGYPLAAFFPFSIGPFVLFNLKNIWTYLPCAQYNVFFIYNVLITLLFSLCLSLGFLLS